MMVSGSSKKFNFIKESIQKLVNLSYFEKIKNCLPSLFNEFILEQKPNLFPKDDEYDKIYNLFLNKSDIDEIKSISNNLKIILPVLLDLG
jgi:hypothetical protein